MILIANPGSSTLKLSVHQGGRDPIPHSIELHDDPSRLDRALKDWLDSRAGHQANGFGVRIVHGGTLFSAPVRVTDEVLSALARLSPLAPLHMEPAIRTIESIRRMAPHIPVVASFDTAFHSTLSPEAYRYAVPEDWYMGKGVRKFGFHGLSYDYIAWRMSSLLPREKRLRMVALHLGNGASGCAILDGRSVETTMGMTPLDGLVMGTRPGMLDPGVLLTLLRQGLHPERLEEDLNHRSGLLGVSGVSSDYREVESAADQGDSRALLALRMAARRAAGEVAWLASAMEGISCLVFTGGIGEHSASFRKAVCDRLGYLGVRLDERKNNLTDSDIPDRPISDDLGIVSVWIVEAREDWTIARDVEAVLSSS